ncbi:MAG: RNA-guided endonuclease InsQ/TnpB family protein [Candidatus Hydrothermarchaeales archaeon]
MRKAFKFRLYPNRGQRAKLEQTLETCRILYNNSLAERRAAWKEERRSVSYHEQAVVLPSQKESDPRLQEVHSQVLQDVLRRVDKAFQNFFRRVKNGGKPGHPRFRGRGRYDSFTYPQFGFAIVGKKLRLSKIGEVNIKLHRPIEGEVRTCTLRRDADHWYACFSVELPDVPRKAKEEIASAIGVDLGLKELVTLSTGEAIAPPKYLRKSEEKLAKEQRRLSKKKKGSNNRRRQKLKIARVYRKVRNQRSDFLHKLSRKLVDSYDLIAFEDLNIGGMMQSRLAKSIQDAGWSALITFTRFKAEEAGTWVSIVDCNGTSQLCCRCGARVPKSLSTRVHRCGCGLVLDRDVNAAVNILLRGLKSVGLERPDLMPVGGLPLGTPLKQEATLFKGW